MNIQVCNVEEEVPKLVDQKKSGKMKPLEIEEETYQKYVYENRVWFWDSREDPFAEGEPEYVAYTDLTSTIIEKRLFDFINKRTEEEEVVIHPDYVVNVKECMQYCIEDRDR